MDVLTNRSLHAETTWTNHDMHPDSVLKVARVGQSNIRIQII